MITSNRYWVSVLESGSSPNRFVQSAQSSGEMNVLHDFDIHKSEVRKMSIIKDDGRMCRLGLLYESRWILS